MQKCRHYHRIKGSTKEITPKTVSYFTPLQIAALYNFPSSKGDNQKVGIIELGGGYRDVDTQNYFTFLGISDRPNAT